MYYMVILERCEFIVRKDIKTEGYDRKINIAAMETE